MRKSPSYDTNSEQKCNPCYDTNVLPMLKNYRGDDTPPAASPGTPVSTHASVRRRHLAASHGNGLVRVSTHASVRRRLPRLSRSPATQAVSTHASVRRRQFEVSVLRDGDGSFNSRLREEATPRLSTPKFSQKVSTHASVRRRREA